jgi:hypothetical protein
MPHKCMACDEAIAPGLRYRLTVSMYDGHWERMKHCERCWRIYMELRDASDHYTYIDPWLNCGEVWEMPPEHVAALAFAIPSDFTGADDGEARAVGGLA